MLSWYYEFDKLSPAFSRKLANFRERAEYAEYSKIVYNFSVWGCHREILCRFSIYHSSDRDSVKNTLFGPTKQMKSIKSYFTQNLMINFLQTTKFSSFHLPFSLLLFPNLSHVIKPFPIIFISSFNIFSFSVYKKEICFHEIIVIPGGRMRT